VPIGGGSYRQFGFLDGVAVIVHKDNPLASLDFQQLDAVFSTTRWRGGPQVTKWSQLGVEGDLEHKKIKLYGIQPWNGFEEFFRQRVLSVPGKRGQCKLFSVIYSHSHSHPTH
jgi:phosphate transport system substrate-binding protein